MTNTMDDPITLCVVGTEMEATLITDALTDRGIDVQPAGIMTGGFRAEAPGSVKVLVLTSDYQRAKQALNEYRQEQSDIDWSKVDVGEEEE